MARWLTVILFLCLATPVPAQNRADGKAKNRRKGPPPAVVESVAVQQEDESNVVFAFDPGSHTRPILAVSFNSDQSRLITVGLDYTIQIWSVLTGERLDIIRLPAYGRDNGFDPNRWDQAAISSDGAYVAVGGGSKRFSADDGQPTRLVVVDVARRRIRRILHPASPESPVTCLAFSADGNRLAAGFGGTDSAVYIQDDVKQILDNAADAPLPSAPTTLPGQTMQNPDRLALSRSGHNLVVGPSRGLVASFDVSDRRPENWKKRGEFTHKGLNDAVEWAPDESNFVWSWSHNPQKYGMDLRSPDGQLVQSWSFPELTPGFGGAARVATFHYLNANQLFISAHGQSAVKGEGAGCLGVLLNPKTGETVRHFFEATDGTTCRAVGAATTTLAATVTDRGRGVAVYSLIDGKMISRCGSQSPVPTIVGWSDDRDHPAIAWSDVASLRPWKSQVKDLTYAFDLDNMEPVADVDHSRFSLRQFQIGDWKLLFSGTQTNYLDVQLVQGTRRAFKLNRSRAMTLIANGDNAPLVARSAHDQENLTGSFAYLNDASGKVVAELLPMATQHQDMVASPDGRYLLVSTGTHRMSIYRTDGSRFPFLNLVQANGEWVCWTPEGYYTSSPGGEKMIGWAEYKGADEFPVFHTADKFAAQFRRPDVLKLAIKNGSLTSSLEMLKAETRSVEDTLPPNCELKLLSQTGNRVQIQASATSRTINQPIVSLRLLLDGRPMANGIGHKEIQPGQPVEAVWEVEVPAGGHELKLLARTDETSSVSESLLVNVPKSFGQQPVLFRLCVGVDEYSKSALNLTTAAKDATDVYAALAKHCVGPRNRFGDTQGSILTNAQATRPAVLQAMSQIRKAARPGDLVVFMFAGHGVKQQAEYYLMTHEADPGENLSGSSLSGEDLRQSLADIECPVLLMLDSCHSASGVKSFRPATDELTRSLTDESAGVTVLAAAMAHEVASATAENGHFTAAFLKALALGQDVPFDHHDHLLYTHHIYSVVFSEVRKATNGRQNPFLNMPWTVPPLALREVPL